MDPRALNASEPLLPKKALGCWSRVKKRWNSWTAHFWQKQLNSPDALQAQNRGGYVVEWINTSMPIADVMTFLADISGLSNTRWASACYAFVKDPSFGLTWGGVLLATPFAGWLSHVDVKCHAAQSVCIKKKDTDKHGLNELASPPNDSKLEAGQNPIQVNAPGYYFADAPNDPIVQGIFKVDPKFKEPDSKDPKSKVPLIPVLLTRSQWSLTKWHFFKDTVEKINPPLQGIKIVVNVARLLPYLCEIDPYLQENTSEGVNTAISVASKILLYLLLGRFAMHASRLNLENTVTAFEEANGGRQMVSTGKIPN